MVVLNLFVAIQTCLDLAAHWLADAGWDVPRRHGELFLVLADHDVIPRPLAVGRLGRCGSLDRLAAAP